MAASVLTRAHQRQLLQIKGITAQRVRDVWNRLDDYRSPDRFLEQVVPIVEAGQTAAVRSMDAYIARALGAKVLGLDPREFLNGNVRTGTTYDEVYGRPFRQLYWDLANDKPFPLALGSAEDRAADLSIMDVALSSRAASVEAGRGQKGVTGWARVPDANACDFCLLASTQRYATDDLQPLHNFCNCDVEPLTDDGGQVLDQELLDQLNAKGVTVYRGDGEKQIYGKDADGNRTSGVAIKEHGEYGPVLVDPAQNFRTADEVPGGKSATDHVAWAEGQGWNITEQSGNRVSGERDGVSMTWELVRANDGSGNPFWRRAADDGGE